MADISLTAANIRPLGFAVVEQYEASAALEVGEAVALIGTGKVRKISGATDGVLGVVVATQGKSTAAAAGEMVSVVQFGLVTGFTGMVPGQLQYLSANAGNIADTGSIAVGYAKDAETLMVMPALADIPT